MSYQDDYREVNSSIQVPSDLINKTSTRMGIAGKTVHKQRNAHRTLAVCLAIVLVLSGAFTAFAAIPGLGDLLTKVYPNETGSVTAANTLSLSDYDKYMTPIGKSVESGGTWIEIVAAAATPGVIFLVADVTVSEGNVITPTMTLRLDFSINNSSPSSYSYDTLDGDVYDEYPDQPNKRRFVVEFHSSSRFFDELSDGDVLKDFRISCNDTQLLEESNAYADYGNGTEIPFEKDNMEIVFDLPINGANRLWSGSQIIQAPQEKRPPYTEEPKEHLIETVLSEMEVTAVSVSPFAVKINYSNPTVGAFDGTVSINFKDGTSLSTFHEFNGEGEYSPDGSILLRGQTMFILPKFVNIQNVKSIQVGDTEFLLEN